MPSLKIMELLVPNLFNVMAMSMIAIVVMFVNLCPVPKKAKHTIWI